LNIENEKYFVSKNRGAAPLSIQIEIIQLDCKYIFR
jgi:hypothetical protein